jgi:phage shock protein E
VILDIRTPEEYARGHLVGAVLVPTPLPPLDTRQRFDLWSKLREVTTDKSTIEPLFVYCKKGVRAGMAKHMLEQMGFTRVVSLGGVEVPEMQQAIRTGKLEWTD